MVTEKMIEAATVACECTKASQGETCPVGYPSLLCEMCGEKGHVPYVKLDGHELWEIVFGVNSDAATDITDAQYDQIAKAINDVFIDTIRPEAALSTDAEPVAYRVRMVGQVWQLRHVIHEFEKWEIVEPLYATPPAPSVAVKADEIDAIVEELLDAQQDINLAANSTMSQSLCDASALIDRVETLLKRVKASALSAQVQDVAGWQSMDTAPKDGKHYLLAVKAGPFVYAVQGAYSMGEWGNAADIHSEPLCWMPLTRIPPVYLPWTAEFASAAPAKQEV